MKFGAFFGTWFALTLLPAALPLARAEAPRVSFGGGVDAISGKKVRLLARAQLAGIPGTWDYHPVKFLQIDATFAVDGTLPWMQIQIVPLKTDNSGVYEHGKDYFQASFAPIEITRNINLHETATVRMDVLGVELAATSQVELFPGEVQPIATLAFKLLGARLAWIAENDPLLFLDLGRFDLELGFRVGLSEGRQVRWSIAKGSAGFAFGEGSMVDLAAHSRFEVDLVRNVALFLQAGVRSIRATAGEGGVLLDEQGKVLAEDFFTEYYTQSGLLVSF